MAKQGSRDKSLIAGIIIMRTPLSSPYKTTELKMKKLSTLLRGLYDAFLRRGNMQNGP